MVTDPSVELLRDALDARDREIENLRRDCDYLRGEIAGLDEQLSQIRRELRESRDLIRALTSRRPR